MVHTKITITSASNRKYISVQVPTEKDFGDAYSVTDILEEITPDIFPSFKGTAEEWDELIENSQSIKVENLGKQ